MPCGLFSARQIRNGTGLRKRTFMQEQIRRKYESFANLNLLRPKDQGAFIEYLTYDAEGDGPPVFYLTWTAKDTGETTRGRSYRRVEMHSGKNGDGPTIDPKVRELLSATYLRPLRDAEKALSAGRSSRLSQVLHHSEQVRNVGVKYDPEAEELDIHSLNVLGIGDLSK